MTLEKVVATMCRACAADSESALAPELAEFASQNSDATAQRRSVDSAGRLGVVASGVAIDAIYGTGGMHRAATSQSSNRDFAHPRAERPGTVVLPADERVFNPSRETRHILAQAKAIGVDAERLCELLFAIEA